MMYWFMSRCHLNVIFALKISLLSQRHLLTVVINMHKPSFIFITYDMSCHGYEGVMSVLCTPLQVKCYHIRNNFFLDYLLIKL